MTYYFECITDYNKESLRAFAKYHYRHVAPAAPIFLLSLGVILLFLGVFEDGGLVLTAMGVVSLALGVNLLLGRFSGSPRDNRENRIRFFDDRVEYAGQQQQGYYTYSQVIRLREDDRYFFLYVAGNQALLVEKARMTLGTPDRLREFLCQRIPPSVG